MRARADVPVGCHDICFHTCDGDICLPQACDYGGGGSGGSGGSGGTGGTGGSGGNNDGCSGPGSDPTCDDTMYCGDDGDPYVDDLGGSGGQCTWAIAVSGANPQCKKGCVGPTSHNCKRCNGRRQHCFAVVGYDYQNCLGSMDQVAQQDCLAHTWPDGSFAATESYCLQNTPSGKPYCFETPDPQCVIAWTQNRASTHQVHADSAVGRELVRQWLAKFIANFEVIGAELSAGETGKINVTQSNGSVDTFSVEEGLYGICRAEQRAANVDCDRKYRCGNMCVPSAGQSGGGSR